LRGSTEKRPKNSGDRSRKKKKRNLARNYLGNLWQNYYMDREGKDTKGRERRDGTKIGVDGRIPWDEEP